MPCAKNKPTRSLLASCLRKWQTGMSALLLACAACGCGSQVIYQTASQPVRLAEPVKAYVFVEQRPGLWVKSANRVLIPQGFDVLPPPAAPPPASASSPP
jgi:hypothetical protein